MFLHLLRREGFEDVASGPTGYGLYHVGFTALGGNHDHRNTFRVGHSRKLLDELQAIHYRHVDVTKDEIYSVALKDSESLGAVSSLQYS